MAKSRQDAALLLLSHGSTESPDSSRPTWELADGIRESGEFGSVHCAFWKEEPSFRQIFPAIEESVIYLIPNFISEGYFTREILPRELQLEGPITKRDGKRFFYGSPVGIHPSMTDLLLNRARVFLEGGISPAETALLIVGHGTALSAKSRESVAFQRDRLKDSDAGFAEVRDVYLEEAPFVGDWRSLTDAENVVVIPFFIADGIHSSRDIPNLLGIGQDSVFQDGPHEMEGRRLFYSRAIGADPAMSGVVLDLVRQFDEQFPDETS